MTGNRLFLDLVDDAGLFEPVSLPMSDALARHAADLETGSPILTHRFLCPTSRLDELRRHNPGPLRLGLVVDTVGEPDIRGLTVDHIEAPLPPTHVPAQRGAPEAAPPSAAGATLTARRVVPWAPPSAKVFVEMPADGAVRLGPGVGLQIRCGGPEPEDFPTPHRLGTIIRHCVRDGVPFKPVGGLHHAVRHPDPSFGVYRHGFLNVLLAVCAALTERDPVRVLETCDPDELVPMARAIPADVAERARRLFVSYGSCVTGPPLDDLADLGLIDTAPRAGTGAGA
ncbi:hypothetical protein [Thermostaphylospora chromogena]|mgnify:CR=1 FL=1|uniref:Uncharacterized protein n=1 Tax=Thermostaphylospora chromogena TaxID=35622 RepID=A0A1H1BM87_9ACTN|nr:hypothetical protein [Thermostaphylospora chromogena]SDQ52516.1 hypothetical protein SAMN04489764_1012 [Thermostaphylospora chromogena]